MAVTDKTWHMGEIQGVYVGAALRLVVDGILDRDGAVANLTGRTMRACIKSDLALTDAAAEATWTLSVPADNTDAIEMLLTETESAKLVAGSRYETAVRVVDAASTDWIFADGWMVPQTPGTKATS